MTAQETADFLAEFNAWRRDEGDTDMPHPKAIGDAIDNAVRLLKEQEEELAKLREEVVLRLSQAREAIAERDSARIQNSIKIGLRDDIAELLGVKGMAPDDQLRLGAYRLRKLCGKKGRTCTA